jgi:hypothetical protein
MVDTPVSSKVEGVVASERVEQRFSPAAGAERWLSFALTLLGALLLGAAFYGAVVSPAPVPGSGYLFVLGVLLASIGWLWGARPPASVRIGDLGVALEGGEEVTRLLWHELKTVRVQGRQLVLEGGSQSLSIPLGAHGQAARQIIAQAARRIPQRVEVSSGALDRLPALLASAGTLVPVIGFQVTGRRCMASGTPITFEADARLCQNCGAVYHARHVPEACVACAARLGA